MIIMADRLEEEGLQARLLLQVHDELIFEAPKEEIEKLEKLVPEVMEHAIELAVPLKVDYSYGTQLGMTQNKEVMKCLNYQRLKMSDGHLKIL